MKKILEIYVRGEPKAQPRPRARAVKMQGKWIATVYQPDDDCAEWKRKIIAGVQSAPRFEKATNPVSLTIDVYFPRPQRLMTKNSPVTMIPHGQKPDFDNLAKAISDALTTAGAWEDDALVYKCSIWKHFIKQGDAPGARILVEVEEDAQPVLTDADDRPVMAVVPLAKPSRFNLGQWVNWKSPSGEFEGVIQAIHGETGEMLTVLLYPLGESVQVDSFIHEVKVGRLPQPEPRRPHAPTSATRQRHHRPPTIPSASNASASCASSTPGTKGKNADTPGSAEGAVAVDQPHPLQGWNADSRTRRV